MAFDGPAEQLSIRGIVEHVSLGNSMSEKLASQVRRAAIYSVGIAGGVGLALLAVFGVLDDTIEMRLYRNCVKAYQDSPICLTEKGAPRLGLEGAGPKSGAP